MLADYRHTADKKGDVRNKYLIAAHSCQQSGRSRQTKGGCYHCALDNNSFLSQSITRCILDLLQILHVLFCMLCTLCAHLPPLICSLLSSEVRCCQVDHCRLASAMFPRLSSLASLPLRPRLPLTSLRLPLRPARQCQCPWQPRLLLRSSSSMRALFQWERLCAHDILTPELPSTTFERSMRS